MPAADDAEWSNWCSNIVCVRTKSSKEPESEEPTVHHIKPIVVTSVYRDHDAGPHSRLERRRRINRRIMDESPIINTGPFHYEGFGKISLNLKGPSPTSSSGFSGSHTEFHRPPAAPPRTPVRVVHQPPSDFYSSSDAYSSGYNSSMFPSRNFQPTILTSARSRSSSLPPFLSTSYARRSSFAVPSYTPLTSGLSGRSYGGNAGSVTSSLRRGSVDVSSYSRNPDIYKIQGGQLKSSPSFGPSSRNSYRRGSVSVLSNYSRPPPSTSYRASVGRTTAAEDDELNVTSDSLSSLRSRARHAQNKLDEHRTLLDKYITVNEPSRDMMLPNSFRMPESESYSRRSSVSSYARPMGSRASSMDRQNSVPRTPPSTPSMTSAMSPARRRIRNVLYKVSGDQEFLK